MAVLAVVAALVGDGSLSGLGGLVAAAWAVAAWAVSAILVVC